MNIVSLETHWFSENRGLMRKVTETALIGSNRAVGQVLLIIYHQNESEKGAC